MERRRASLSDLRQAAVDGELAAGHEAAVVRREKGSRRPELRRIAHAPVSYTHLDVYKRQVTGRGSKAPSKQPCRIRTLAIRTAAAA